MTLRVWAMRKTEAGPHARVDRGDREGPVMNREGEPEDSTPAATFGGQDVSATRNHRWPAVRVPRSLAVAVACLAGCATTTAVPGKASAVPGKASTPSNASALPSNATAVPANAAAAVSPPATNTTATNPASTTPAAAATASSATGGGSDKQGDRAASAGSAASPAKVGAGSGRHPEANAMALIWQSAANDKELEPARDLLLQATNIERVVDLRPGFPRTVVGDERNGLPAGAHLLLGFARLTPTNRELMRSRHWLSLAPPG
jgi:hypothetical protein